MGHKPEKRRHEPKRKLSSNNDFLDILFVCSILFYVRTDNTDEKSPQNRGFSFSHILVLTTFKYYKYFETHT
jgi:hypothetical protein